MIGFGLDALSVIFELLIYQFFFHHFFGKPRFSKAVMVLVYGAVGSYRWAYPNEFIR